jgi:uncharacterized protein YceK
MNRSVLLLPLLLGGCSVTRPITIPSPASAKSHAAARVTDSTGRNRWMYRVRIDGDTLRGFATMDRTSWPVSLPMSRVAQLSVPRFSPGRTAGLAAALVALVALYAALLPEPVYGTSF